MQTQQTSAATTVASAPRLRSVAICRNGKIHSFPKGGSHYDLRMSVSGEDTRHIGDVEGFITDAGIFVTRREAVPVGIASGQLHSSWREARRDLLSSDVNW